MPNWCFTTYRIYGSKESRDKLESICKELEAMPEPRVKSDFGNMWMGCMVDYLGGDWHNVACRGMITEYGIHDDFLDLYTETAWCELGAFRKFLKEKFPDIDIYYISEEPGMEEYYTNDVDGDVFYTHYCLDSCDVDIEPDYFDDMDDVIAHLNSHNIDGLEKFKEDASEEYVMNALKEYSDRFEDKYITLHKFEIDKD